VLLLRAPRRPQERLRHRHTHRVPEARDGELSSLAVRATRRCVLVGFCVLSSTPAAHTFRSLACRGRAEVAPGPVGQRPRRGRRGQAAVPADPGGLLR
jgi:hypothetical protein